MRVFKKIKLPIIMLVILLAVASVAVIAIPTSANYTGMASSVGNELIAEEFIIVPNGTDSTDLSVSQFYNISGSDVYPGNSNTEFVSLKLSSDSTSYWACAKLTLKASDENDITKPEVAASDTTSGIMAGELDDYVDFVMWADNNLNTLTKYDSTENVITSNLNKLPASKFNVLRSGQDFSITYTIADSSKNLFTNTSGEPLSGNEKYRVGSSWCFGDLTENSDETHGLECSFPDGTNANIVQTDSLEADLQFYIVQYRNNNTFTCDQWQENDNI